MTITATTPTATGDLSLRTPARAWTLDAVRNLGVTTDIPTTAKILGIGRSTAYELASQDKLPVKVIRIGHRYLVPTAAIIKLLEGE